MKHTTFDPVLPPQSGLVWRALTRDDLAALHKLAVECHSSDGGLAFMYEPDTLSDRHFPDEPGLGSEPSPPTRNLPPSPPYI